MDILDRLRKRADDFARERAAGPTAGAYDYLAVDEQWDRQAADEIERLRVALRMVIDNVETGSYESTGQAIDEAKKLLGDEQRAERINDG